MPPLVRFPAGPITPHGAYHILHNRIPQMGLLSYDGTVVFHMLGGLSIADRAVAPGRVEIKDLKGLIPPWRTIDQKGATQDGVSFVDALYDAIEVELGVRIRGKDPADCRRVGRYLYDSLDVKREAELFWFTQELGRWWSKVRWLQAPADSIGAINKSTENVGLRLRADTGFWESYPTIDEFSFTFAATSDAFDFDDPDDLGSGWTTSVTGAGAGGVHIENGEITPTLLNGRTMVARKNGYTSTTDNQVVEMQLGTYSQLWYHPTDAYEDLWARLNNTGTPGTSGLRLRLYRHKIRLSYFVGSAETVLRERILIVPPLPGEKWRLIPGNDTDARTFVIQRGRSTIMTVKETGTGSPLGTSNRSAGVGMRADGSLSPLAIRDWKAGDNNAVKQSGFVDLFNVGDQDMWINFTCFGPGTFRFWNGPNAGANEYVEFGPLLPGQIMYIRTKPGKRGVDDLTQTPPTPQQLTFFQKALSDFLSFAVGNNATPLAEEIKSLFGIRPPQGNPYSLLKGRFSVPLPPKSPGKPAEPMHIKVEIDNGTADSKILAAGTPLRRMPY
jgi:hypothetical protein